MWMNEKQREGLARISDTLCSACFVGLAVGTLGPQPLPKFELVCVAWSGILMILFGLFLRGE